jgi:hypothetical protein
MALRRRLKGQHARAIAARAATETDDGAAGAGAAESTSVDARAAALTTALPAPGTGARAVAFARAVAATNANGSAHVNGGGGGDDVVPFNYINNLGAAAHGGSGASSKNGGGGVSSRIGGPSPQTPLGTAIFTETVEPTEEQLMKLMGRKRKSTFRDLPFALRRRVYTYLLIIPMYVFDDLRRITSILLIDDATALHQNPVGEEILDVFDRALKVHKQHYAQSGLYSIALCLSREAERRELLNKRRQEVKSLSDLLRQEESEAPLTYADRYRTHLPHVQRDAYRQLITVAHREISIQRTRSSDCRRWVGFRDAVVDRTCRDLRTTLRRDVAVWREALREWRAVRDDVCLRLVEGELDAMARRVRAVEFVGDPALEIEDVRNMLHEARDGAVALPDGVSADFAASLTLGQIVRLGIADVAWVRGYAWEDRDSAGDAQVRRVLAEAEEHEAVALSVVASAGVTSLDTRTFEVVTTEDADKAADAAAANEAQRLSDAKTAAARAMSTRVWRVDGRGKVPPHKLQHGACELCAAILIHHLGMRKAGAPTCGNVALCQGCYEEVYAPNPTIHRMYDWHLVSDLVAVQFVTDPETAAIQREQQLQEQKECGPDATADAVTVPTADGAILTATTTAAASSPSDADRAAVGEIAVSPVQLDVPGAAAQTVAGTPDESPPLVDEEGTQHSVEEHGAVDDAAGGETDTTVNAVPRTGDASAPDVNAACGVDDAAASSRLEAEGPVAGGSGLAAARARGKAAASTNDDSVELPLEICTTPCPRGDDDDNVTDNFASPLTLVAEEMGPASPPGRPLTARPSPLNATNLHPYPMGTSTPL